MSRNSLLLLSSPDTTPPSKRGGGSGDIKCPPVERQSERLAPIFSRLETAIENRRLEIQNDTAGIDPEYTVVIETYGAVSEFFKAIKQIQGLEWLSEHEVQGLQPDDDFYSSKSKDKLLNGHVMLMLSDRRAIDELLSLWRKYTLNPDMTFERGWAKFRDVFRLLKDIRYWDSQDRIRNTGIYDYWQEHLAFEPNEPIKFEAELWFREDEQKRKLAFEKVTALAADLGGKIISSSCIPEISYHSLLIELPAIRINEIIQNQNINLVRCDQVMLFRPLGQMSVTPLWSSDEESTQPLGDLKIQTSNTSSEKPPRVALFDGLPISNHHDLAGSLIIDDPDCFENEYPAIDRVHGTAMASLIVNGDLNLKSNKLASPLYVRPIMKPNSNSYKRIESIPENELPLDLVHRAVKRIFEYNNDSPPAAPSIKIINLSIGDPNIHFDGQMSPFARLLDWLSSKYNVLFIVSAGNHSQSVPISQSNSVFHNLSDTEKAKEFFDAIQKNSWNRKLLSPAESINAITVGSTHEDESNFVLRNGLYNLYDCQMPASYSAQGNGYLRSVKPDIVTDGGRVLHNEPIVTSEVNSVLNYASPGQLVAHPSRSGGIHRVHTRGTSNSAALISRGCSEVCEVLETLFSNYDLNNEFEYYASVLIKALVAHGASWGGMYEHIASHTGNINPKNLKKLIAKNIGYGKPNLDRVKFSLDTRATMLGFNSLQNNEAHTYKIPIPEGLGGTDIWRRLTITLSWFASPCPKNVKYRDSALWLTVEGNNKNLTTRNSASVDWQQVRRGTLQHEIFEGEDLAVITGDKTLEIKVNCKDHASKIIEPIRYGVAITLEVAEGTDIQLYKEIQEVIEEQIRSQEKSKTRTPIPTR